MTLHIEAELSPDSIIQKAKLNGIHIRATKIRSDWSAPRIVRPGGTALAILDFMGDIQLHELQWDARPHGDVAQIGFMDGFRPSFGYRCLIAAKSVTYPVRLGSEGVARADAASGGEAGSLWLGGCVLVPDQSGHRTFCVLTAPLAERNPASNVEPITVSSKHWRQWLTPQFHAAPLQRSPTVLRSQPALHLTAA